LWCPLHHVIERCLAASGLHLVSSLYTCPHLAHFLNLSLLFQRARIHGALRRGLGIASAPATLPFQSSIPYPPCARPLPTCSCRTLRLPASAGTSWHTHLCLTVRHSTTPQQYQPHPPPPTSRAPRNDPLGSRLLRSASSVIKLLARLLRRYRRLALALP